MVRCLLRAPRWWPKPTLKVARVVTILAVYWAKSAELDTIWIGMMAGANPRLVATVGLALAAKGFSL
jgi:hypothetical protein